MHRLQALLDNLKPVSSEDRSLALRSWRDTDSCEVQLRLQMLVEKEEVRSIQDWDMFRNIDRENELVLFTAFRLAETDQILAVGRFFWNEAANIAEVAGVVHEKFRGQGIASYLLESLVDTIRKEDRCGVMAREFSGNVPILEALHDMFRRADDTPDGCGETVFFYRFAPRRLRTTVYSKFKKALI